MTVFIRIAESYAGLVSSSSIEKCVSTTLKFEGISPESDLSILVEGDRYIQQLNREFLGIDASTDVLSFPAGHVDPDTGHINLGDVVISCPQAKNQANQAGHTLSAEISLLVVHGVLHLLGYDHDEPDRKTKMWTAQTQILDMLSVELNSPEFIL